MRVNTILRAWGGRAFETSRLRCAPEGADPVLAHVEQILRDGQASGSFGDFDARSLAIMIRGAIDAASRRIASDPAFDLPAYTRQLVGTIELTIAAATPGTP